VKDEKTCWEYAKRDENHRRKRDGVIPRYVLLSPNPALREQMRRILGMVSPDMNMVKFSDSMSVPKEPMKKRLDKGSPIVSASSYQ
jgi:hypothetical protein